MSDSIGPTAIETIIVPRTVDLDGFEVHRALPSAQRRTIGPFVFFDAIGPAILPAGSGIDVRPHPHIGLSTVTYLHEGSIVHRDSLGCTQAIVPGEINWMTAGRGIVHSERSSLESRQQDQPMDGLQLWVGLPSAKEEIDPAFVHYEGSHLPRTEGEGVWARVLAGSAFGLTSTVETHSPTLFCDIVLVPDAVVQIPAEHVERAVMVTHGQVEIEGQHYDKGALIVFAPGHAVAVRAETPARLALVGGEPLDGPRFIWWNFVSSRKDRLLQAREDWERSRMDLVVPDDAVEFILAPPLRAL